MKLKLSLLISLILLSGCSLFQPEVVVKTELVYVKVTCPQPPKPGPVTMLPVRPRGIQDSYGIAWIGLTPKDYENLSINFQQITKYMKLQKGQTKYYHDCILDFNSEIEKLESQN